MPTSPSPASRPCLPRSSSSRPTLTRHSSSALCHGLRRMADSRSAGGGAPSIWGRRGLAPRPLLDDLGDAAGAHGTATLTDGEAEPLVHGDGVDELDVQGDVV